MYIFNENETFFLDKNQNVIDTFELGYKFSATELNKVKHVDGYKYYICLSENEKIADLNDFSENLGLSLTKINDAYDKHIISNKKYITFCLNFTSNMTNVKQEEIDENKYYRYQFNNCRVRIILTQHAIIFKTYSGYVDFETLFKRFLDVDVVSGGFLQYWKIMTKEIFQKYSNYLFTIVQNLNKLSLQFNNLDYYKLQDCRKLTIEYNVLLDTLYNELQSFLFTNSNLKNTVLFFPFEKGLDRYIQKKNKDDPCACSDKIYCIDDYPVLREAKELLGLYGNVKDGKCFYGCHALEEESKKNKSSWCYVNNPEKCKSSKKSNYIDTEEWNKCSAPDLDYNNLTFLSSLEEIEVSVLNQVTEVEQWRGYTKSLIEGIMNAISFFDSKSDKILSIVSSFFLPLGVAVGWYGMNFKNMPELLNPKGYRGFIYLNIIIILIITYNYREDILFFIKDSFDLLQIKKLIPRSKNKKEEFVNYKIHSLA
jgi:hypothetical protein